MFCRRKTSRKEITKEDDLNASYYSMFSLVMQGLLTFCEIQMRKQPEISL